ncbi:MAG TPA: sensor histidine kinase [Sphingomicrobium sp.]|nr:sensor histidine kinase [Sphingomicrobium sp.]
MTAVLPSRFNALPTAAKLLIFISLALLPLGLGLVWVAGGGIRAANQSNLKRAEAEGLAAIRAIESLIARDALALRIAANGALRANTIDPCATAAQSLALSPGVARNFSLRDPNGKLLCTEGDFQPSRDDLLVAPGDIRMWIAPRDNAIYVRVGVIGGMATGSLTRDQIRDAALAAGDELTRLVITDQQADMVVVNEPLPQGVDGSLQQWAYPIANHQLVVRIAAWAPSITTIERLLLLLPVLMWVVAALISWVMVNRLLIAPLRRLQRVIGEFQPGDNPLVLPSKLGPATEIQDLGNAFVRAVKRIDESERQMSEALEGQRKLVREVHHRVKNNLQVIASLLNIHGRSVVTVDAKAAYAAIGRRVDALAVVHRNHFAEMEESRGIAVRPLLTELAASLRASAPDSARKMSIELEVESLSTTQDVAVAVAFLITEVVEFAMLRSPEEGVEVTLRRTSELTARLSLSSAVLAPDAKSDPAQIQFERIVSGLAKQLRSPLDRKLGRYMVDLPVFPEY